MGSEPVLVAPDSFKGTVGASEVAAAIADGLRSGGVETVELPVADGGDGTLDALVGALGGEYRAATVSDPVGRSVEARFGLLPDGRAVVEMARASGLALVEERERDAWGASTRGTGELIAALEGRPSVDAFVPGRTTLPNSLRTDILQRQQLAGSASQ